MSRTHDAIEVGGAATQPPFVYEIRVKGRLSPEQWTSWFDDLDVASAGGETLLRGRAPDHSALYGILARLRDLAVPLVAVRVLDEEAQRELTKQSRRYDLAINFSMVALYLVLLGGLATITVFVAPVINTALALTLLFASLGGIAHAFWLWSGHQPWRWIGYLAWPASTAAFLVFIPLSQVLPTALGIAITLLLGAGGLVYLVYYLRNRSEDIRANLANLGFHVGGRDAADHTVAGRPSPGSTPSA